MVLSDVIYQVIFYAVAALVLGSALIVAMSRNIVHSAFALLLTFFSIAGIYVFLSAEFLAVAQVVIYVGGILVLILFAVMLTNKVKPARTTGGVQSGGDVHPVRSEHRSDHEPLLGRSEHGSENNTLSGSDSSLPVPGSRPENPSGSEGSDASNGVNLSNPSAPPYIAAPLVVLIFGGLVWLITHTPWKVGSLQEIGTINDIGNILMGKYLLAFEVAAVLLLGALLGAAYLARRKRT